MTSAGMTSRCGGGTILVLWLSTTSDSEGVGDDLVEDSLEGVNRRGIKRLNGALLQARVNSMVISFRVWFSAFSRGAVS
jgi:hypothetical protein